MSICLSSAVRRVALLLSLAGASLAVDARAQATSSELLRIERRHGTGQRDEAIADLERLLRAQPRDLDALLLQARLLNQQGAFAAAERVASRVLELAPELATAHLERGLSLSRQCDEESAAVALQRAVAATPSELRRFADRGERRLAAGDHEGALADFESALRLAPNSTRLQWGRGRALTACSEFASAADALEQVLEQNASSAVWCDLVMAHLQSGLTERALEVISRRVDLAPHDVEARLLRAHLSTGIGLLDAAAADCRTLLAMAPDDRLRALLHERLGVLWWLRGDEFAARQEFARGGRWSGLLSWATLLASDPVAARAALPGAESMHTVDSVLRPVLALARDGEVAKSDVVDDELRGAIAFVKATRAAAAGHQLEAEVECLRAVNGGACDSPFVELAAARLQRRHDGALAVGYGCDLVAHDDGLLVHDVDRCGAAAEQGLRRGDVLLRIGRYDADLLSWRELPGHQLRGRDVVVVVRRDGAEFTLRLRSGLVPTAEHVAFVAPSPAAKPN